jgi:hypothetical protein
MKRKICVGLLLALAPVWHGGAQTSGDPTGGPRVSVTLAQRTRADQTFGVQIDAALQSRSAVTCIVLQVTSSAGAAPIKLQYPEQCEDVIKSQKGSYKPNDIFFDAAKLSQGVNMRLPEGAPLGTYKAVAATLWGMPGETRRPPWKAWSSNYQGANLSSNSIEVVAPSSAPARKEANVATYRGFGLILAAPNPWAKLHDYVLTVQSGENEKRSFRIVRDSTKIVDAQGKPVDLPQALNRTVEVTYEAGQSEPYQAIQVQFQE